MFKTVIKVDGLSKRYRVGTHEKADTLSVQIKNLLTYPVRNFRKIANLTRFGEQEDDSVFWALKGVSFDVEEGEVLGVIGHNGAGKSTLLKILSRITEPTKGQITIRGRVSSLLEVGTGFHPELTGRDNVYMNGTILGMRKREIDEKFEEIVTFSGIEKHIDTPVKFYSSGMRVRLAFSVAAHLEPEILIIDEVLAVGDAEFQKKCLGKMEDVAGQGRTVLFVSHNMQTIQNLCSRAMLLDHGQISYVGGVLDTIHKYLSKPSGGSTSLTDLPRTAGHELAIVNAWCENLSGEKQTEFAVGDELNVVFEYNTTIVGPKFFGFGIETFDGIRVFSSNNQISGSTIVDCSGRVKMTVRSLLLIPGEYSVSLSIVDQNNEWVDYVERALVFEIIAADYYGTGKLIDRRQGLFLMDVMVELDQNGV